MRQSKILRTQHVLAVKDLAKSVEYYKTKLGFETIWHDGAGWHCVGRQGFNVMLGECSDDVSAFETNNHSYFAYVNLEGVDDLHEEFAAKGVNIMHRLASKPWGQREFGITTIDGHRIMFGETLK